MYPILYNTILWITYFDSLIPPWIFHAFQSPLLQLCLFHFLALLNRDRSTMPPIPTICNRGHVNHPHHHVDWLWQSHDLRSILSYCHPHPNSRLLHHLSSQQWKQRINASGTTGHHPFPHHALLSVIWCPSTSWLYMLTLICSNTWKHSMTET